MKQHYTLITNLEYVWVNGVRTFTHALLVEETEGLFEDTPPRRQILGFGTEGSAPTFDLDVPSIQYEIGPIRRGGPILVSDSGNTQPLFSAAEMRFFKGGPTLRLHVADPERPLDIQSWEGDPGDRVVLRIWEVLPSKVATYWRAPRMPIQQYVSPALLIRKGR